MNNMWMIYLGLTAIFIAFFIGLGKVFKKAGYPAWMAFIPFVNYFMMTKIAGLSQWFFWLTFVPLIGFVTSGVVMLRLAQNYEKSTVFAVASVFFSFITIPIIGFDDSVYKPIDV